MNLADWENQHYAAHSKHVRNHPTGVSTILLDYSQLAAWPASIASSSGRSNGRRSDGERFAND
jgi:hypothetical protein